MRNSDQWKQKWALLYSSYPGPWAPSQPLGPNLGTLAVLAVHGQCDKADLWGEGKLDFLICICYLMEISLRSHNSLSADIWVIFFSNWLCSTTAKCLGIWPQQRDRQCLTEIKCIWLGRCAQAPKGSGRYALSNYSQHAAGVQWGIGPRRERGASLISVLAHLREGRPRFRTPPSKPGNLDTRKIWLNHQEGGKKQQPEIIPRHL